MTDKTLTAADFAAATFAIKRGLYPACRSKSGFWRTESGTILEDDEMARDGWRIVTPSLDPSDPDVIEEAAIRARDTLYEGKGFPWENAYEDSKELWRAAVRAAFAVLIPPPARDPEAVKLDELVMTAAREVSVHLEADVAKRFADSLAAQYVRVGGDEE